MYLYIVDRPSHRHMLTTTAFPSCEVGLHPTLLISIDSNSDCKYTKIMLYDEIINTTLRISSVKILIEKIRSTYSIFTEECMAY